MQTRQSLLITKYIRKILVENISYFQNRVYSIDARVGTKLPFCVIIRDSVTPQTFSKDGLVEDSIGVSIYIISKDYDGGVIAANDTRNLLDRSRYSDENIRISLIEFTGADENYVDSPSPAFIQHLRFNVKI